MDEIKNTLKRNMIAILVVVVILLAFFFAGKLRKEDMSPIGYGQKDINDRRRIYFHYTNWCKHCATWKPVWENVKIATRSSGIDFIEVDEEKANTPYVQFFPSVYMLSERGHRYQYKGPPDFAQLRNWCVSPMPIE